MSRVEDLIRELCPEGVQRIPLTDLTGQVSRISWSTKQSQEYQYIDLSSVDLASGKIEKTSVIDYAGAPSRAQQVVLDGDVIFATTRPTQLRCAVISREFDGQIASTGYCVLRPQEGKILTNYLAHCLRSTDFLLFLEKHQVPGNYPSISDKVLKGYEIWLPPRPVQEEIVRILDTFTELEEELKEELKARTTQYEETRNRLTDFDFLEGHSLAGLIRDFCPEGVAYRQLFEITQVHKGEQLKDEDFIEGPFPVVTASRKELRAHVRSNFGPDVVTITSHGAYAGHVNYWETEIWLANNVIHLEPNPSLLGSRFLYFALTSRQVEIEALARGGGVPYFNSSDLLKVSVPVPPIPVQEEIVRILDSFDSLVKDPSVGLPAEIAARRKQYEYYRDKLLNFDGLAA